MVIKPWCGRISGCRWIPCFSEFWYTNSMQLAHKRECSMPPLYALCWFSISIADFFLKKIQSFSSHFHPALPLWKAPNSVHDAPLLHFIFTTLWDKLVIGPRSLHDSVGIWTWISHILVCCSDIYTTLVTSDLLATTSVSACHEHVKLPYTESGHCTRWAISADPHLSTDIYCATSHTIP